MGKIWKHAFFALLAIVIVGVGISFFLGDDEDEEREIVNDYESSVSKKEEVNTPTSPAMTLNFDGAVREPQVRIKGNGDDKVTIMVYMNGSDLESDDNEATTDLQEMIKAGSSENVNIVVQTMGTKSWAKTLGIASDRSQIYCINEDGFNLVKDDLGQLDCTATSTLKNFVTWSAKNYPADRYMLVFWNHGGGPVYGFGYDQFQGEYDALTIDEMQSALKDAGVYFDFIGMDCCIMSSLEVSCALYDLCDYTILSEDFESGLGWSYTAWLKELYKNTSITVPDLGKYIVDSMISANKDENEEGILAVIDQGKMKVLYSAWTKFAFANEDALAGQNYSQKRSRTLGGRVSPVLKDKGFFSSWLFDDNDEEYSFADYYITDIMAVAQNINSDESRTLSSAVASALIYVGTTSGDANLTGISITIPYGDSDFYTELKKIFTNCGFDSEYVNWLGTFVDASGSESFYDYDEWDDEWNGWDDYEDEYDWDDEGGLYSFFCDLFGYDDEYDDEYYDDYDDYGDWDDWDDDWGWFDDDWSWDEDYYDDDWDW